ncbi:protein disulfide-isomerase A6 homolog isoform X2 [Lingula anatina]|uniref:protein disulfide-isomerase n=1 Tax=Lingula anatina TaxID=7574 RepID=A0A1S3JU63_LINAN|nr:protein disulfide-isomerase A6 homolog isoform X1 [Lingula anatina]XP_013413637.1 protein disulfide-isomerase A6 homolog isoform X2 [Lingula anatina]|eukprot:XP_013413636.1 protein disulfide-isomerase A6 homolog isoform X1 [Lingula anatina]
MQAIAGLLICGLISVTSALYSSSDDVIELTAANFNQKVIQSDQLWLVEFYAPWCGHCQSLAPEWKKAATALKGVVNVGAVDMDQHQSVGGPYGIRGFPTIKIFGANKNKAEDYNGARSANAIVDSAMSHLKQMVQARLSGRGGSSGGGRSSGGGSQGGGKAVIELTDSNFEELVLNSEDFWLVEFFAPWCGHCKNLAPHWEQAASELKGKVKLGALDATVHTVMANRYGVRGYPTIKAFPAGKKDGDTIEYDGGRTASDIVRWASDRIVENLPPPEIVQITEEKSLKDACEDHPLCIIAVLPHILDCQSECRNKYLDVMKELGDKYKGKQWGWVWAEAMQQPELEDSLGIGGFGYPAMAAMNARKMKYAILRGAFSKDGINSFLRELSVGRGSTSPVKNAQLPPIKKVDPWDGKDGKLEVEEEIDLSDVELEPLDDVKKDEL